MEFQERLNGKTVYGWISNVLEFSGFWRIKIFLSINVYTGSRIKSKLLNFRLMSADSDGVIEIDVSWDWTGSSIKILSGKLHESQVKGRPLWCYYRMSNTDVGLLWRWQSAIGWTGKYHGVKSDYFNDTKMTFFLQYKSKRWPDLFSWPSNR